MKLKTSFCNPTLLKKNISRYAVIWGLYTGLLFMSYTLVLLNSRTIFGLSGMTASDRLDFVKAVVGTAGVGSGVFQNQFFALISAIACFSYLHKTRSAYMLHAFPITRNGLYSTNLITGLLFGLAPQAFITLLNVLATAWISGAAAVLLRCLLYWVLEYLFFYGLAVFCMVLTGKTVFGILCYFTLNYIAVLLELVVRVIAEPLLFGLASFGTADLVSIKLSPTVNILDELLRGVSGAQDGLSAGGVTYLFCIAGAGAVFMLASWLLYRLRHMENAGEVIAYRKLKPYFKYFFTVCVSLSLGLILTAICDASALVEGNGFGLLVCLLIAGLIGYFAAEMMLGRTLRVFKKKAFAGFGIFAAIMVALFCIVQFDVFGVVHRIPTPESVRYVELISEDHSFYGDNLTVRFQEPEDIKTVTQLHQTILNHRDNDTTGEWVHFTLTYHLNSGITVRRTYNGLYGTASEEMENIFDRAEVEEQYYNFDKLEKSAGATVTYTPYWADGRHLNAREMQQVIDALKEDIEANTILFYDQVFQSNGDSIWLQLSDDSMVYIPYSATATFACLKELVPPLDDYEEGRWP